MRRIARELRLFGIAPLLIAMACGLGLIGGITSTEALVPVYLIGVIFALTAAGIYGFAAVFRSIRWLIAKYR